MLRRALKRSLLALALVAPTLATVPLAPTAIATFTAAPLRPIDGAAFVGLERWGGTTGITHVIASVTDVDPETVGGTPPTDQPDYHHAPGQSFTLRLEWESTRSGGASGEATQAEVYFKDGPTGSQIGATKWTVNLSSGSSSSTQTIHFDSNPMNGSADTERAGNFHLYVKLVGTGPGVGADSGTISSCGLPSSQGINDYMFCALGLFSAGFMASADDGRGMTQFLDNGTDLGRMLPLTRTFNSGNWGLPASEVRDYAEQGVGIIHSVKPKGANFTKSSNESRWETVADGDQDSGANGLIAQVQELADIANDNSVPIMFAISHEPHDDDDACSGAGGYDMGCPAEFKSMYDHLQTVVNTYGNRWLKTIYIAVESNMVKRDSSCSNVVGCLDDFRPDAEDYDLLGPDVYNYYRWKSGGVDHDSNINTPKVAGLNATGDWDLPSSAREIGNTTSDGVLELAILKKKHVIIPEWGTHPGCPGGGLDGGTNSGYDGFCPTSGGTGTKDAYFRDMASNLTSNADWQKWIIGWTYYHQSPGDGALYDWQFVNVNSPSTNKNDNCPNARCWDGDNNASTGWVDSFINNSTYNSNHGAWFVGSSTVPAPFIP